MVLEARDENPKDAYSRFKFQQRADMEEMNGQYCTLSVNKSRGAVNGTITALNDVMMLTKMVSKATSRAANLEVSRTALDDYV